MPAPPPPTEHRMTIRQYPTNPFIHYSGHVYSHLQACGVKVARRGALSIAAIQLQELLRHPQDMIHVAPEIWNATDFKTLAPAFEQEFGIDLEGIDETVVRLMIFYALTSLLPGQDLTTNHISIQDGTLGLSVAVGIYLLQTEEHRTTGIEFLTDAATQLDLL